MTDVEKAWKYWEQPGFPKDTCGMDHYSDPDHCTIHCKESTDWLVAQLAKAREVVEAVREVRDDKNNTAAERIWAGEMIAAYDEVSQEEGK